MNNTIRRIPNAIPIGPALPPNISIIHNGPAITAITQ